MSRRSAQADNRASKTGRYLKSGPWYFVVEERWSMLSVQEDVALDLDIALKNECSLEETFQETKQKMKRKCLQRYKHMSVVRCKYFPFTRKNIFF